MDSDSASSRISKDKLRLFVGCVAIIALILTISVLSLKYLRDATLQSADKYVNSYSNVVAQHADNAVNYANIVLSSIADYLARTGVNDAEAVTKLSATDTIHRMLKDRLTGMPQVASFMIIDNGGRIVATSYDFATEKVNLSDRDYFQAIRDDPAMENFVSAPVKSRISGTRVFLLVRRLSDPNGAFMGLLVGALSQRYFEDYYAATAHGDQTVVRLQRSDGNILAARPSLLAQQPPNAYSPGVSRRSEDRRTTSANADLIEASRRIVNFPLSVTVSQTYDDVLQQWRTTALLTSLMSACIASLVLAFGLIIARNWRMQAAMLAKLGASEALAQLRSRQFETTLENLPQGVCMYDGSGRVLVVNEQYARLYDLDPAEIAPGDTLETVIDRRIARGCYPGSDAEIYRSSETYHGVSAGPALHRLPNGRVITVSRYAMSDGGWISQHMDVTEEHKALERVHFLARHDSLTRLCNRAQLMEKIGAAFNLLRIGQGQPFCIHLIDLDMFKAVNDTLGHGVGDKLLQQVGARLREVTRIQDVVARLGGDEFAVMQPLEASCWREGAEALARRLLARIAEPYAIDGHSVVIGASIGVAQAPENGWELDDVMAKADMALYKAKTSGRNTARMYDSALEKEARQRHDLQLDLHAAIAEEQFELRYQPIVAAATGNIACVEALVRWRHPRNGLIGPDSFIPVAEESGVIVALGEWVLRRACRDALSWPEDVRVAVNISPVQLKKGDLAETVARILAETGIGAHRLELEITEGVFMNNREESFAIIARIRKLGVTISLDDFGTGYSSLVYIRAFPLDKIKIDRSFVAEATQRQDCAAIVSAVVYLARSLNLATVAEGVETEEHLQFVRAVGCTYFQGYYFGRPSSAQSFLEMLTGSSRVQEARAI